MCTRKHQRFCRSSRYGHWGLSPILVANQGHPSHVLGHRTPTPHTRRLRPHVSHNPFSPRILVVLGRHSPCASASQALVTSQSGPFASRAFTTIPYTNDFAYPSHLFRILLLRRLRLPLPLFARTCRCRRTFDSLGDHRAACAQSGALRSRGGPLERAAARVCREAGARVTTHTRLADLNVQHVHHIDDRRIEVIANGLALWGGAQLAVDTTLVSPLTRAGEPRRRAGRFAAAALHDAKERAYPELLRNSRCRLVVLGIEVGGRWSEEAASFITNLARAKRLPPPSSPDGQLSSPTQHSRHLQPASFSKIQPTITISMAIPHPSVTSSHNSHQTPQTPAASPPSTMIRQWTLCLDFTFWTLHIWRLASIKTVLMPGS